MRLAIIILLVLGWANVANAEIVPHPAGCPKIAFCGCGLSVRLFGKPIRDLFLASNWARKFRRAFSPEAGMAAVKRGGHHVFGLLHHIAGDTWMVYDANSGHHQTRIHPRSIRGYIIVDPTQRR